MEEEHGEVEVPGGQQTQFASQSLQSRNIELTLRPQQPSSPQGHSDQKDGYHLVKQDSAPRRTMPKPFNPETRTEEILARTFDQIDEVTTKRKMFESTEKSAAFSDYSLDRSLQKSAENAQITI